MTVPTAVTAAEWQWFSDAARVSWCHYFREEVFEIPGKADVHTLHFSNFTARQITVTCVEGNGCKNIYCSMVSNEKKLKTEINIQ